MVSFAQALACGALVAAAGVGAATQESVPAAPQLVDSQAAVHREMRAEAKQIVYNACYNFQNFNWDTALYVCAYWHNTDVGRYANVFIRKYNGERLKECGCRKDVEMYNPWGSRWTRSTSSEMVCYTRDGKSAASVRSEFNSINCPAISFRTLPPGFGSPAPAPRMLAAKSD